MSAAAGGDAQTVDAGASPGALDRRGDERAPDAAALLGPATAMFLISAAAAASTSCRCPTALPPVDARPGRVPASMYASSSRGESSASSNSGRSDPRSPVCSSMRILSGPPGVRGVTVGRPGSG